MTPTERLCDRMGHAPRIAVNHRWVHVRLRGTRGVILMTKTGNSPFPLQHVSASGRDSHVIHGRAGFGDFLPELSHRFKVSLKRFLETSPRLLFGFAGRDTSVYVRE